MNRLILALLLVSSACMEQSFHSSDNKPNIMHDYEELPAPDTIKEHFYDPANRPVNMIMVIDRSGSMGNDQQKLWDNMDTFIEILDNDNIDYRIAFISTEGRENTNAGLFPTYNEIRWLTPKTFDPSTTAKRLLDASGGYTEQGIDALYGAFVTNYDANQDFWRGYTPLHLVTISDEPDQSIMTSPQELYNVITDYENSNGAPVTYSAVVTFPVAYSDCELANDTNAGTGYAGLTAHLGGTLTDICENDWTESINDIAYLATEQPYEYYLGNIPMEDTIEVLVEEGEVTFAFSSEDWIYNPIANSITFVEYVPSNLQVIAVSYIPVY